MCNRNMDFFVLFCSKKMCIYIHSTLYLNMTVYRLSGGRQGQVMSIFCFECKAWLNERQVVNFQDKTNAKGPSSRMHGKVQLHEKNGSIRAVSLSFFFLFFLADNGLVLAKPRIYLLMHSVA